MLQISVCSSFSGAIRVTNTGKPERKEPIGRPTRWMDNVEADSLSRDMDPWGGSCEHGNHLKYNAKINKCRLK